ncbi:MAG: hypothetical protein ACE5G5_00035 [Candidatus Methylomirabilales bacterium]
MEGRLRTGVWALVLVVCLASPAPGWGEDGTDLTDGTDVATDGADQKWERFQFKMGVSYEQGDFGTDTTTRSLYMPLTLKYLGERFDLGLTIPVVYARLPGDVTLVDGRPEFVGGFDTPAQTLPGFGDLILKGRVYAFNDPGADSPLPGVAPTFKVKFPTARSDLGTGEYDYGFGLELDKQLGNFFLFADVGYTFIGDPPGRDLRNRMSAGGGLGYSLTRDLSAAVSLAWSRSVVSGSDDPTDVYIDLSWRISPTLTWTPFASFGLTDGSADFGVGFQISKRFGRF